jgi:hypothetical protein
MQILLYCLAAFIIGFLLAWLIKKAPSVNTEPLETTLESYKKTTTTLETEKEYLLKDKQQL